MRNKNRSSASLLSWIRFRQEVRIRPKRLILSLTLVAAILSWGCPKNDPLQAFNPPPTPIEPGPPAPVPEPGTALLLGTALLIGGAIARRRRNMGHR
jgi:hypothetical protein